MSLSEVPSAPHSLIDRIKFLEDHIMLLEKNFPPWAALHFNQPNRGVSGIETRFLWGSLLTMCSC